MAGCFERKGRRMFQGIKVNENWMKWYNKEMMWPFGKSDVLSFIRTSD